MASNETVISETFEPIDESFSQQPHETSSDGDFSATEESQNDSKHDETVTPVSSSAVQVSRKTKGPEFEDCIICSERVKKMRDHLSNSHQLNEQKRIKQFISTYHSTLHTKRFQCVACLKRMSLRHTHPQHHKLERIYNRTDVKLFPFEVQMALRRFKEQLAQPCQEIVEEFSRHMQGLANDGDIVSVTNLGSTVKTFLGEAVYQTNEFSETTQLAPTVREFKDKYNLKRITIGNYLVKLKKFHELHRFPEFKKYPWDKILDEVRLRYQSGALKERKSKTKELYSKVPTLHEVQEIYNLVQEFLEKDLTERVLNHKELSTLNFLILSFRLCCRAGTILNLTWSDVHTIEKTGYLETDHHKTGRLYYVTIEIEQDQFRWLKRLKSRFVREFRTEPKYVFSSSNKVEHSMAKKMKTVLSQLFNKDHSKDFHATAVRKMWDTHFHKNRKK